MKFKNFVTIVTGGNYGIGYGIAKKFAEEGSKIAIVARNDERGNLAVKRLEREGFNAKFFKTDVSKKKQVKKMISNVLNCFGKINIVINNAGCGSQHCGIQSDDPVSLRWKIFRGSNLDSTYYVSAYALPYLAKNKNSSIVNISSTATFHGNWGLYGVAKTGVEGMTRSFAVEASSYGIRVNCISPGWIETSPDQTTAAQGNSDGIWDMQPSLFDRMGTTEEIANTAAFLASKDASFITGQTLVVDGGLMILDYPSKSSLEKVGHRVFSHSNKFTNN